MTEVPIDQLPNIRIDRLDLVPSILDAVRTAVIRTLGSRPNFSLAAIVETRQ